MTTPWHTGDGDAGKPDAEKSGAPQSGITPDSAQPSAETSAATPPRLPIRLLEAFLSPEHDAFIGDLEETWALRAERRGETTAFVRLWIDTFVGIPRILVSDLIVFPPMLRNYLNSAVRNLLKNRGFSAINIFGLAVSMAMCLLIVSLVRHQKSFDTFHERADDIYRVTTTAELPWGTSKRATSPGPLGPALADASPFIDGVVRMRRFSGYLGTEDRVVEAHGLYVEDSFLDLFTFPLSAGNAATALERPRTIVLSASLAEAVFGASDPLGESVVHDGVEYEVTGVATNIPEQSHLQVDAWMSFSTLTEPSYAGGGLPLGDWSNSSAFYTYVRLAPGADPVALASVATDLIAAGHTAADVPPATVALQPIRAINLGDEMANQIGNPLPVAIVYSLGVLGLLLIATAVFNYMTLSVARSLNRAREIGVRKVVGAGRGQLIRQFLSEAVFISVIALVVSVVLLVWLVPLFNGLGVVREQWGVAVTIDWAGDGVLLLIFLGVAVVTGVLAGLYPAVVMSRFTPSRVLKGQPHVGGMSGSTVRRILIVSQFTVAIVGIVVTLVMHNQFDHLISTDYGFDQQHIVHVDLQGQSWDAVSHALGSADGIASVGGTSVPVVVGGNWKSSYRTASMDRDGLIRFYAVDGEYVPTMGLDLIAGRNFHVAEGAGEPSSVILDTRAVQALGFESAQAALGEQFEFSDSTVTIVGVVEAFRTSELASGNEPTLLVNDQRRINVAIVRIRPGRTADALTGLRETWQRIAPAHAFSYGFFDDQLEARFSEMQDAMNVLGFVVMFIVFIACLGLLGMASYTTDARVREIGIRKVLGAENRSVIFLMSRDYILLVSVAALIGLPLAYILARLMLQEFADPIAVHAGYFLAGIFGTLGVAIVTVGSQTWRAGRLSPVDALRSE